MARTKLRCVLDGDPLKHLWHEDLTVGVIYKCLPATEKEAAVGLVRVVDDSGEDYLYPASLFEPVEEER